MSPIATSKNAAKSLRRRVYVREANAGMWIVHDESDSKGGCFRSRYAALRFVEDTFGLDAEIEVQPRFSTVIANFIRVPGPLQSIAQRVAAAQGAEALA